MGEGGVYAEMLSACAARLCAWSQTPGSGAMPLRRDATIKSDAEMDVYCFGVQGRRNVVIAAVPALSVRAGCVAMEARSGRLMRWGIRREVLATVVCCAGMV